MVQQPTSYCPTCRTPAAQGQRFCSNCGGTINSGVNKPTEMTPSSGAHSVVPDLGTQFATPPPPPSAFSQPSIPPQSYQTPAQGTPPPGSYQSADYGMPPKDSSKNVLGQIGCVTLSIILVILALCGGAGYFAYHYIAQSMSNVSGTATAYSGSNSTTSGTGNSSSSTGTSKTVTFTHALSFIYADVNVTINDVKYGNASAFTDDNEIDNSQPDIVRLDVKEQNATSTSSEYSYDAMHLLLPDGTSVAAYNEMNSGSIDNGVTRNNWIDFPIANNVTVSKLTLQIGNSSKAQENIPLIDGADLSKYQPVTVSPNVHTVYSGVTWTVTSVTEQLSAGGQQAASGQTYIMVTFRLDNNSTTGFVGDADTFTRLKSGATTSPPSNDTLPVSVDAGQTNVTGICTFVMPQGDTNFTVDLLASSFSAGSYDGFPGEIRAMFVAINHPKLFQKFPKLGVQEAKAMYN